MTVWRQELQEWARGLAGGVPGSAGRKLRAWYYAQALRALGRHAILEAGLEVIAPERVSIGDEFVALRGCLLCADGGGDIVIGHRVSLATNVMVNAGQQGVIRIGNGVGLGNNCVLRSSPHNYQDPARPFKSQGHTPGTIIIEDDVWVAANTTILPGAHLQHGCVVGSGSVVSGLVKAYSVVAGNPAIHRWLVETLGQAGP